MKLRLFTCIYIFSVFLPVSGYSITLKKFVKGMNNEQRAWYLVGVYDSELIRTDYKGDAERSECVEKLGPKGFLKFLNEWYNRDPDNVNNTSFNVALVITLQIYKVCNSKKSTNKSSK